MGMYVDGRKVGCFEGTEVGWELGRPEGTDDGLVLGLELGNDEGLQGIL